MHLFLYHRLQVSEELLSISHVTVLVNFSKLLYTGTVCWYCMLVLYAGTVCWYCILELYTGTVC